MTLGARSPGALGLGVDGFVESFNSWAAALVLGDFGVGHFLTPREFWPTEYNALR
jgi:hypothetical protein